MISPRISIPSIILAAVLLTLTICVISVHASSACQRLVHTYVTVPVRNRVSKATAMAWGRWRTARPNWKSNPKIQRPRYVMTTQEALDKVGFACESHAILIDAEPDLTPRILEDYLPVVDLLAMNESQIASQSGTAFDFQNEIATVAIPAPDGESGPVPVAGSWLSPSFFMPTVPGSVPPSTGEPSSPPGAPTTSPIASSLSTPVVSVTPEPSSLLLVATGIGAGWLFCRRRREV